MKAHVGDVAITLVATRRLPRISCVHQPPTTGQRFNDCQVCIVHQVAQLWQRDRAKLDTFSINVQRIRNCALCEIFITKNLVAEFHRENVSFTRNTAN